MRAKTWLGLGLFTILAPSSARGQFETLPFVELPALGAWAEHQVTRRNESQRMVVSQRVASLGRVPVAGETYRWFQIEIESDDLARKRVPVVTQIAVPEADAALRHDLFRKTREMIVQAGGATAFRIPRAFLEVGMARNVLTGGTKGAGSEVEYAWRDLAPEEVKTAAGTFRCSHKKGVGRAELVLNPENPMRYPVDSVIEVWYTESVPFGLVRQVTKTTGAGPQTSSVALTIDSEETVELVACGAGAQSEVKGPVVDYSPQLLERLRPPGGGQP